MDRITAIEKSLTGFTCGLLGFLPVIGVFPATYAITLWMKVRGEYHDWNPASGYLNGGAILGLIALLISMISGAFIAVAIVQSASGW